ncbi:MAG: prephenate dehydrogenase/arogenate dehydrogenase family protein [Chloroflexota bacterium]|jgi:prephenate dehydrogenase
MKTERVGIIGLDKVSGSIGLALQEADLGLEIIGADRDRSLAGEAKRIGVVDKTSGNPLDVARVSDILILSVPVAQQAEMFQIIGDDVQEHTLVVDLSDLKGPGLKLATAHLRQGHYVGVSPVLAAEALADGRSDLSAARADLFRDSVFCIMASGTLDEDAVQTTVNLGRILGATPFFLDAYEYDSLVKGVETIPGLVSAAMFRAITRASGWRDMLRFAGSTFSESTAGLANRNLADLAMHDKAATLRWLDAVLAELEELRRWLMDEDPERLALILEEMAQERERWLAERRKNNWIGVESPEEISSFSIAGQLFGFGSRKKKKE